MVSVSVAGCITHTHTHTHTFKEPADAHHHAPSPHLIRCGRSEVCDRQSVGNTTELRAVGVNSHRALR